MQTDAAFDSQIDNLCREIGRRGLARQTDVVVGAGAEATVGASCPRRPLDVSEAIPPVSAMAPGVAAAPAPVFVETHIGGSGGGGDKKKKRRRAKE